MRIQIQLFCFASLVAFMGSLSCAEDTLPEPVNVGALGSYNVGFRLAELTYQPVGLSQSRTLPVALWYPTEATQGGAPLWGNSLVDAKPIEKKSLPVLIYTHGTTSFPECAYDLMEHFASHGFVVASASHVGDTVIDVGKSRTTEMFIKRPQDISALIDWLYNLPSSDSLSGRLSSLLALAGHSYGGFNSLAAVGARYSEELINSCLSDASSQFCSTMTPEFAEIFRKGFNDTRIKAVLPMAPGNAEILGPEGVSNVEIPILHMTASLDGNCPNETDGDPYWQSMTKPGTFRVNYDKGGHHSYIATCSISPDLGDANGGGCGEEFTEYTELLKMTNAYALAFVRYHLLGDLQMLPILSGEEKLHEEITVTAR